MKKRGLKKAVVAVFPKVRFLFGHLVFRFLFHQQADQLYGGRYLFWHPA